MAISPQRLTIYLYSAHRAVIFAIAQLSCFTRDSIYAIARIIARPSVRPSHGWIIQKRLKLTLWNFRHTVAASLWFLRG